MTQDDLAIHLNTLQRDDCYRVDEVLKQGEYETTERVSFIGNNGAIQGPYIRKHIERSAGLGSAYELLFKSWKSGNRFKHIPIINDCYRMGDDLVVVMEDVAGETLQDVIYRVDPSLAVAIDIFPRICDAVIELHESFSSPIIHRDLKPSNIMLTQNSLTLIDFGIARIHKEDAEQDTHRYGTKSYAPPEQFGFGQTDVRSDVYALGMILYYCLAEQTPTSEIRNGGFVLPGIPESVRAILVKSTQLDPADRFGSVREMKEAFLQATPRFTTGKTYLEKDGSASFPKSGAAEKKTTGNFLSRIPRSFGIVWNVFVLIVFAFFFIVCCSIIANPTPPYDMMPVAARIALYMSLLFLVMGPFFYLVLDKRAFKRVVPSLSRASLLKQALVCAVIFVIGFFVVGVLGLIWN